MNGLLSRIGDPEFDRECAASCAAQDELERKRSHIDGVLQRIFAGAVNSEYEAAHCFTIPEAKRHHAELNRYFAFCAREGLPADLPASPLDVVAYLLDCGAKSASAVRRAYRVLEKEHRRRGYVTMHDVRIRVFMRGIRNLSVKKKSTVH